jgi:hypothetical protein
MTKADLFAYLAGFVTIMLAIALTDMVQSTHRLLRDRARVKWDALTPMLAIWVFLWVLSEFFSLWVDARFDRLTYFGLLGLVTVPTLTSLAAFAVLPDEVPATGLDLQRFYFDNLRLLVILLALIHVGDVGRIVIYAARFNGFVKLAPWLPFLAMWGVAFASLGLMYFVRTRWAQFVGLFALLANAMMGFASGYISAQASG